MLLPPPVPAIQVVQPVKAPLTSPEVAALLPPPIFAGGFQIEFLNAGFASPQEKDPDTDPQNAKFYSHVAYFFTYRITKANGDPVPYDDELRVKFRGFSLPDDSLAESFVHYGGSRKGVGRTVWSYEVNPRWRDVGLSWSVQALDAPPEASGRVSSTVAWKDVPIPAREGEVEPVEEVQTTLKGTRLTLQSVTRRGDSAFLRFIAQPQNEVAEYGLRPDVQTKPSPDGTRWPNGCGWSPPINEGEGNWSWDVHIDHVGERKEFDLPLSVEESSRTWRDTKKWTTVSTRLPVAPLLQLARPQKLANVSPFLEVQTPVHARVEWQDNPGSSAEELTMWVSPDKLAPGFRWWPKGISTKSAEGNTREARANFDGLQFWHFDNTPRNEGETPIRLRVWLDDNKPRPSSLDMTVDLEQAQVFDGLNRFKNIPLPPFGSSREFKAGEFEDETVALRRIVWLRDTKEVQREFDGKLGYGGGARLAMVFDYLPTSTGQREPAEVTRFDYDGVEPEEPRGATGFDLDAGANGKAQPNRLTFMLPVPLRTAKTVSLSITTREVQHSTAPPFPVLFKGLVVPPSYYETSP